MEELLGRKPFKELDNERCPSGSEKRSSCAVPAVGGAVGGAALLVGMSPQRKSPRRKKARVNHADENEAAGNGMMVECSPVSNTSGPAFALESDGDSLGAATPPINAVDLNTRRNALRPVTPISAASSRSVASRGDATVTLAAFQEMLDSAHCGDTEEDNDDEEEDDQLPEPEERPAQQVPVAVMVQEDSDDDFLSDDDRVGRKSEGGGSRRNTASPSFLRDMLGGESSDEDELIQVAAKRGKEAAEKLARGTEQLFTSPQGNGNLDNKVTPPTQGERSRRHMHTGASIGGAGGVTQFEPTPLKSCISARKSRDPQSRLKKKSVVFGSPDAAEFDTLDPVKGGVTPLNKNYARTRFKMEDAKPQFEADDDELEDGCDRHSTATGSANRGGRNEGSLLEEDQDTALNSSILATWEEEEEVSSRGSRGRGSSRASGGSSSSSSRRSGGSRNSSRRASGLYKPGSDEESPLVSRLDLDEEDPDADREEHKAPPQQVDKGTPLPSPGTAETQVLRAIGGGSKGSSKPFFAVYSDERGFGSPDQPLAFALNKLSPLSPEEEGIGALHCPSHSSRDSLSSTSRSPTEREGDRTVDTLDLADVMDFTSPVSKGTPPDDDYEREEEIGHHDDRTVDLQSLAHLASFSPASLGGRGHISYGGGDPEERTVELGSLSELAALGSSQKSPSRRSARLSARKAAPAAKRISFAADEERTVELGSLSDLAALNASPKGSAVRQQETAAMEDTTVELGSLSELANLSSSTSTKLSAPRSRPVLSAPVDESRGVALEEDRTVELGALSDLAALESTAKPRERSGKKSTSTQDRTVELGSLSELAALCPTKNRGLDLDEPFQVPSLRLSFSSLASARRQSSGSGKASDDQGIAFDPAALLAQFVHSPSSTRSSYAGDREDENMSFDDSSPHKSPSKSNRGSSAPNTPAREDQVFAPRNDLSRTPARAHELQESSEAALDHDDFPMRDKEDVGNMPEHEQNLAESGQREQESLAKEELVDVWTFLSRNGVQLIQVPSASALEEMEQSLAMLNRSISVEGEDITPTSLTADKLESACVYASEVLCGDQWGLLELSKRSQNCARTVLQIASGLGAQPIEQFLGANSEPHTTLAAMVQEARYHASLTLCDLRCKAASLRAQAADEHLGVLAGDEKALEEGIETLDSALAEVKAEIELLGRCLGMWEQHQEQVTALEEFRASVVVAEQRQSAVMQQVAALRGKVAERESAVEQAACVEATRARAKQGEEEIEGRLAFLDVAQGLQSWRLYQADASKVVLAVDHAAGGCDLLSITIAGNSSGGVIENVTVQCERGEELEPSEEMTIRKQIEAVSRGNIAFMASDILAKGLLGKSTQALKPVLRRFDVQLGRLQDIAEEILEVFRSTRGACAVRANGLDIEFSAELVDEKAGCVVDVVFVLHPGYPVARGCVDSRISVRGESASHAAQLSDSLRSAACASLSGARSFSPLSDVWSALSKRLSAPLHLVS